MDLLNDPPVVRATGSGGSEYRGITLCLANNNCETTFANKDFQNNSGQTVDGIDWLVQGSFSSVVAHYDGPYPGQLNSTFSSFTIVPSGANTLLGWSGTAAIPNGSFAHVGSGIPGTSLTTLGASWTTGGGSPTRAASASPAMATPGRAR